MSKVSESQKKASLNYYYRNRDKILEKRKERYKNDDIFKTSVIETIKKYRQKKSEIRKKIKEKAKEKSKNWRKFKINGEIIEFCKPSYLAKSIGRTVQTIRLWEKNGFIPKSVKYRGIRYYSKYQYDLIVDLWNKYGEKNLYKFFNEVNSNWRLKNEK